LSRPSMLLAATQEGCDGLNLNKKHAFEACRQASAS
jgi:hypothetical protein